MGAGVRVRLVSVAAFSEVDVLSEVLAFESSSELHEAKARLSAAMMAIAMRWRGRRRVGVVVGVFMRSPSFAGLVSGC